MTNIIAGITKDLKAVPKKLKEKAKSADVKKLILLNLPYVLAGYFCNKAAFLWRVVEASNASDKMMVVMSQMDRMFSNPFPSFFLSDLLIGIAGGVALKFIVYYKAKNAKKFRQGVEYGSARWGNAKDIEPYMDSVFENNILLTATERLMMSGRPKEPKYARNKNIRKADAICAPHSIHVRVPLVEGVNDDVENIRKTAQLCQELKNCQELEFLSYHRLGLHAYRQLGRNYQLEEHASMSRWDVYQKMGFLCETDWMFDIAISGLEVYKAGIGKTGVTEEVLKA